MREIAARADRLTKRFLVLKTRRTTLRALRALVRGDSLKWEHWVLRDLTFEIERGEKLAVVGRNGSGKTTLLRILTGIYRQTSGTLIVSKAPRALLNFDAGFQRDLSVVDNAYLFGAIHGVGRRVLRPRERAVLEAAGLEHLAYGPLRDLSTGQVRRLALSVFSHVASDFLVLDEVLANVDRGFVGESELFRSLAAPDTTLVMTSHNATLLREYCRRGLWLEDGRIRALGPINEVIDEYERSFEPAAEPLAPPVVARFR